MATILLIGTGRLAFHLGHALQQRGLKVIGVTGRDKRKTAELAQEFGCAGYSFHESLPASGLRIVAVSDDAIHEVAALLPNDGTPVAHLSGSKPLDLLNPHVHRAVLWPIHSFGLGSPVDFRLIPVVVDASDEATLGIVKSIAQRLSGSVVQLPFLQRQRLHLSAVLASNFPAILLREAERLLKEADIDPGLLHPLWKTCTANALQGADQAVTGPARRGDTGTIAKQMELLAQEPELRRVYSALSDLILHTYHPKSRGPQDI